MATVLDFKFVDLMDIMWRPNLLFIDTEHHGEYVLATEVFTGIRARGVSIRGAKANVAKDVLKIFEAIDAKHVGEQLQQHDPDFAEIYGQRNLRRFTLVGRLNELLGPEPRRVLRRRRELKPLIRKAPRTAGLRSISAAFKAACMGRSELPF